jgi:hypothetical protein
MIGLGRLIVITSRCWWAWGDAHNVVRRLGKSAFVHEDRG